MNIKTAVSKGKLWFNVKDVAVACHYGSGFRTKLARQVSRHDRIILSGSNYMSAQGIADFIYNLDPRQTLHFVNWFTGSNGKLPQPNDFIVIIIPKALYAGGIKDICDDLNNMLENSIS